MHATRTVQPHSDLPTVERNTTITGSPGVSPLYVCYVCLWLPVCRTEAQGTYAPSPLWRDVEPNLVPATAYKLLEALLDPLYQPDTPASVSVYLCGGIFRCRWLVACLIRNPTDVWVTSLSLSCAHQAAVKDQKHCANI